MRPIVKTASLLLIAGIIGGSFSWLVMVHPIITPDFSAPAMKLSTFLLWFTTPLASAMCMLGTILVMAGIVNSHPVTPRLRIAPIEEEATENFYEEFEDWDNRFDPQWRLKRHEHR